MSKTRVSDLWQIEEPVELSDGKHSAKVLLRKISSVQNEDCVKRAKAAQALFMIAKRDHESEEYLSHLNDVMELNDPEFLAGIIAQAEFQPHATEVHAKLAFGEGSEWAEDDYLQTLLEAWGERDNPDSMQYHFAADQDDLEAKKVFDELTRFGTQLDEANAVEVEAVAAIWRDAPIVKLEEKAAEILLEQASQKAWFDRYQRVRIYYAARQPDHPSALYFDSIREVMDLPDEAYEMLCEEYVKMSVDVTEGKESPVAPASSPPSESPEVEEATETSGPEAVSA